MLVWLMALAIPVQGVAAVGMLHCAASPQQEPLALTAPAHAEAMHAHGPGSHHAHPAHAGHGHDGHHVGDGHGPAADDPADNTTSLGHKCSACAACCAGLALPAHAVEFSSPIVASFAALPPGATPVRFVLGRLDRPPRPTLA